MTYHRAHLAALLFVSGVLVTGLLTPGLAAQQYFQPIGIGCIANAKHTGVIGPNASYATLPRGRVAFGGVPFTIPATGNNIWHAVAAKGPNPRRVEVAIGIPGVTEVHTLINTFWGRPGPSSYASVEFFGSKGARHTVALVGNSDIRDFAQYIHTNGINNKSTTQVWAYRGARLDKQRFVLPAVFAKQTLTKVRFSDSGGDNFQRIFLVGLTVKSSTLPILGEAKDLGRGCGDGGKCAVGGTLSLGAPVDIQLTGADPSAALGFLILGGPNRSVGCGSCSILLPLAQLPLALKTGSARLDLRIPCDRNLVSAVVVTQWLILNTRRSPCSLAPGLSASNQVRVTVGY